MSGANFSEPFIRRPVGTTLLAIGLFLVGAVAYRFLPVASMPTVDFPTINVTASRPGADPETMAATVAAPLERRLGEIAGVTELTSRSSLGSTRITIQFDLARNIDGAARDVQAEVNVNGAEQPAMRVRINPIALASMGLSMEDVRTAIASNNAVGPVGEFDGN